MQQQVSLQPYNTLALPVSSRYFEQVTNLDALRRALRWAHRQGLPVLVLGGGSNLILREDFPGLCVQLASRGIEVAELDDQWLQVTAEAGEPWHPFVDYCLRHGAYGLENLALIPGTVGAAPIQNVGAYGVEIKDFLLELQALERQTLELHRFSCEECGFGYRESHFKGRWRDRFVITSVSFRLRRTPELQLGYGGLDAALDGLTQPRPRDLFEAVVRIRSEKLPDPNDLANVGSFFKNPVISESHYRRLQRDYPTIVGFADGAGVKLAAGWLIDTAGWKGYRQGPVGVHERQALVLVNYGGARSDQLLTLAARIQEDIERRFGVLLEIEPRIY